MRYAKQVFHKTNAKLIQVQELESNRTQEAKEYFPASGSLSGREIMIQLMFSKNKTEAPPLLHQLHHQKFLKTETLNLIRGTTIVNTSIATEYYHYFPDRFMCEHATRGTMMEQLNAIMIAYRTTG